MGAGAPEERPPAARGACEPQGPHAPPSTAASSELSIPRPGQWRVAPGFHGRHGAWPWCVHTGQCWSGGAAHCIEARALAGPTPTGREQAQTPGDPRPDPDVWETLHHSAPRCGPPQALPSAESTPWTQPSHTGTRCCMVTCRWCNTPCDTARCLTAAVQRARGATQRRRRRRAWTAGACRASEAGRRRRATGTRGRLPARPTRGRTPSWRPHWNGALPHLAQSGQTSDPWWPVVQAGSIAEPRNALCCSHTCTFTRCRDVVDTSPGVRWGDVAGLDEAKRVLRENVVLPLLLPDLFHGIRRPIKARLPGCPSEACRPDARPEPCSAVQGLLMFGPPGTGARGRQAALAAPCGHALRSQRARAHACARAAGQARPCSQRRSRPSATPPSSMSAHPRWHPSTGAPRRSPRHALLCDLMRCDGSAHDV